MRALYRAIKGEHPNWVQAVEEATFVRALGYHVGLLSLAAMIMIAVTISKDTVTRHGWHDNFAGGTTVVRIG